MLSQPHPCTLGKYFCMPDSVSTKRIPFHASWFFQQVHLSRHPIIFLDFLITAMDHSWVWGRWTVKNQSVIFSAKLPAVAFSKVGLWTGQILLSWIPGLWSYYLSGSLISGSWALALYGVLDLPRLLCLQSSLIGSKSLQEIRVVEIFCEDQGSWPRSFYPIMTAGFPSLFGILTGIHEACKYLLLDEIPLWSGLV